jgi:hypothetical protein
MAKGPTANIRMRVSRTLFDFLTLLKDNTVLGASENDVASYLLTKQLEAMRLDGYLEKSLVPTQANINAIKNLKEPPKA